jgi:hypothetical protein
MTDAGGRTILCVGFGSGNETEALATLVLLLFDTLETKLLAGTSVRFHVNFA